MNSMINCESTNSEPRIINPENSVLRICGGASLQGEVEISGAKNSALVVMAAALLCSGVCRLRNIPQLSDVSYMADVLMSLGANVTRQTDCLEINAGALTQLTAPSDLVQRLRASFFILGSLLARHGEAHIPLPGGCAIGTRPINLHIQGLRAMGAEITIEQGVVHARVQRPGLQGQGSQAWRLQGASINLDYPSVGATETLMMAATLAEGETVIENAAQEPEVVDLANFCRAMGAKIRGAGTRVIVISGVSRLHAADYCILPDRIEAGTFLIAGAITRSPLTLTAVNPRHLMSVIAKLRSIGTNVVSDSIDQLRVIPGLRHQATTIQTGPYPGFPTDMQAQFMTLLSLSGGKSTVIETVFENRLQHVAELNKLGAEIRVKGNRALIQGVSKLSGTTVRATDLRASAALVLAALVAEGTTTIQELHHLDRGYERLEDKLRQLGADLQRVSCSQAEGLTTGVATATSGIVQGHSSSFLKAEVA